MRSMLPVLMGCVCVAGAASAQESREARPAFEVASIKPNTSGDLDGRLTARPGGRFLWTNTTLRNLIGLAYMRHAFDAREVVGGPRWLDSDRFDVEVQAPDEPGVEPDGMPPELFAMLRTLLEDRFSVQAHNERREGPIYALVTATRDGKLGEKLRRVPDDCAASMKATTSGRPGGRETGPPPCSVGGGRGRLVVNGLTMTMFASVLSRHAGRPVEDRTGLAGSYDIELESPDIGAPTQREAALPADAPADRGPSIFTALQEQLGLKLESTRGPVDVLVIDRAEPPTPN